MSRLFYLYLNLRFLCLSLGIDTVEIHKTNILRSKISMVKKGLFVRFEARVGKEAEVENFLNGGLDLVNEEPETTVWFALKFDDSTFGIFDAFEGESGREAHLNGKVAAALMAKADELFSSPPKIEMLDVIAAKISNES